MKTLDEGIVVRTAPFGMDLVFNFYSLAAPLLLVEFKANPIELGLAGSIMWGVHMLLAHRMGPFSDRFGRRRLILASPLLFALSCLIATVADRIAVFLVLSALNGLCLSLFWPPFQAWVAERQSGSGLARDIGTLNLAWTAAFVGAPVFSGFLFGFQPRIPFLFAAVLAIGVFALCFSSIRDRKEAARATESREPRQSPARRTSFLYAAWVANFASWFLLGNTRFQFPKLARELGNSPVVVGALVSCIGLSLFLGFFFLRGTVRWHFRRRYLFGAQAVGAVGTLALSVAASPLWFAPALMLIGFSASVTYYSSLLYSVLLSPEKGKGAGRHESILSIGALLGPMLGGVAAFYSGLRAPYLVSLLVLLAAVGTEGILLRKTADGEEGTLLP